LRDFSAKYLKRYGEASGAYGIGNFTALDVVTQAMRVAGTVEAEKVADRLTSGKFETSLGTIVVGGKATYGVNHQFLRPIIITGIHDGHVVDVGKTMPRDLAAAMRLGPAQKPG
jgi:hypothetical protein